MCAALCTCICTVDAAKCPVVHKNAVFDGENNECDKDSNKVNKRIKSTKFGLYDGAAEDVTKCDITAKENEIAERRKSKSLRSLIEELEFIDEYMQDDYYPVYSVAGVVLDESLQKELYSQLKSRGIEFWMPYSLMVAFQESGYNLTAVSNNGLDMGLFQFRSTYWAASYSAAGLSSADIFNPYDQIYVYVYNIAEKLSSGKDIYTVISDHFTGGMSYDANYVSQVLSWESTMSQLK